MLDLLENGHQCPRRGDEVSDDGQQLLLQHLSHRVPLRFGTVLFGDGALLFLVEPVHAGAGPQPSRDQADDHEAQDTEVDERGRVESL
ncbi:hypothetical protein AB5J62_33490 [Amycolatopsis sp. cg5]|uniref:hypothetical protein n=1 Tax=Amycolatopsis sp. cg5 TaxID=3238802 RepID=UPI0035262BEF